MAEITAALVKELREMTGAGMMECKRLSLRPKAISIRLLHVSSYAWLGCCS